MSEHLGWDYRGERGPHIERIYLSQFRNFVEYSEQFTSSCILLTGRNGVGKTNLLESISLLSSGRGLRSARSTDLVRFGSLSSWESGFRIRQDGFSDILRLGLSGGGSNVRKIFKMNGDILKRHEDILDFVRIVWLLPQMERVFFDGPSARRRLLDDFTCQFDILHRKHCSDYENLLRQRLRLLRDGSSDDIWLSSLESQMSELGVCIIAARFELVRRLNWMCLNGDKRFPYCHIEVSGLLEDWVSNGSALAAEDRMRDYLRENRLRDGLGGNSSVGPNCSQVIIFLHRRKEEDAIIVEHGSAGECRALLISLTLSQCYLIAIESGLVPILLLDEVCVYLDSYWRGVLFEIISDYPGQCFLSATDCSLFTGWSDYSEVKVN